MSKLREASTRGVGKWKFWVPNVPPDSLPLFPHYATGISHHHRALKFRGPDLLIFCILRRLEVLVVNLVTKRIQNSCVKKKVILIWVTSIEFLSTEFGSNADLSPVSAPLPPELSFLTQIPSCPFRFTVGWVLVLAACAGFTWSLE